VDYQRVLDLSGGTLVTVVGRGYCPFQCGFCVNPALRNFAPGKWIRNNSVDYVLADFEQLSAQYDFRSINLRDDNIGYSRNWVLEFCEKYPKKFGWPFDCFSRCDTLDDEMIKALKQAGCQHVYLGLESGNDKIRNAILGKNTDKEDMVRIIDRLNEMGIKAVVSNMIGLPHETPDDFADTIALNKRIHRHQVVFSMAYGAAPKLFIYSPFPGTKMYDECVREGWLKNIPDMHRIYRESYIDMPQFPRREIYQWFSRFRYEVYKERHPVFAVLFRIYDTRAVRFFTERLPVRWFAGLHLFFSRISRLLHPSNEGKTVSK